MLGASIIFHQAQSTPDKGLCFGIKLNLMVKNGLANMVGRKNFGLASLACFSSLSGCFCPKQVGFGLVCEAEAF